MAINTEGKNMTQIVEKTEIEAPRDRVWEALADVSYVHNWHPKVERSPAETPERSGVGAQRTCYFYDGTQVKEEVVSVTNGKRIEIAIVEASMPIRDAVATFTLNELSSGRTKVTVEMSYEMKLGPVGWLMDRLMVRKMMAGMLGEVLAGLRVHVVEGVYVGRDGAIQRAA